MTATPVNPILTILAAVIADAAEFIGIPPVEVVVEQVTDRVWPDRCLGLPGESEGCARAITPGFEVRLRGNVSYRTDERTEIRREVHKPRPDTEIWVHFHQVGGVGGWSSEFRGIEGEDLDQGVAERLRAFILDDDFLAFPERVDNGPITVTDQYSYRLTIGHGRRSHTVSTYDGAGPLEKPALGPILGLLRSLAPRPGATPMPPQD